MGASWTLQQYEDSRGKRPVEEFLVLLSEDDRGAVKAKLSYLQERGNQLREPHSKSFGEGLFELRAKAYRLFFCFRPGNRIVLLHAFTKKSQSTPRRELELARKRMQEVIE
jgi:phage-related protein